MPKSEIYAVNLHRAYPLIDCEPDLFNVITDAKIIVRPTVDYVHGRDTVDLRGVVTISSPVAARLQLPAGGLLVLACSRVPEQLFVAAFGEDEVFSDAELLAFDRDRFLSILAGSTLTATPVRSDRIEGWVSRGYFLVVSRMDLALPLEPTCVLATVEYSTYLGQTFVYNQDVTRYSPPPGCEHMEPTPIFGRGYTLACGPLDEQIKLIGGSQVRTRQQTAINRILLEATPGSRGEGGTVCPDIVLPDGAPRCNEVVRTINGLGGPNVSIVGFSGVAVEPHSDLNRVIVNIGTNAIQVCDASVDSTPPQVEYIPTNTDGQLCGNFNQPPLRPGEADNSTGYAITIGPTPAVVETPSQLNSNLCWWQAAAADDWELSRYPCNSPTACAKPDRLPRRVGEVVHTACLTVPIVAGDPIRNGDFSLPDVPFGGWDLSEDTQVITAGALPGMAFPMVEMLTEDSSPAGIRQTRIAAAAGMYLLQLDVYLLSGALQIDLIDESTGNVSHTFQVAGIPGSTQRSIVLGPIRLDHPLITLLVAYHGSPQSMAYVGFFTLLEQ